MGAELRQEMGHMRAEFTQEIAGVRTELKQEIADLRTEVRGAIHHVVEVFGNRFDRLHDEMGAMHADLSRQIAGAARAAAEENRREIGIVDDKYRDVPGRIAVLERELDEHRRDTTLHPRRPKK